MTADQFNAAVARLGLSQGEAAKLLGVSIRSAHGYANGATIPEPVARQFMLCIMKLEYREIYEAERLNTKRMRAMFAAFVKPEKSECP